VLPIPLALEALLRIVGALAAEELRPLFLAVSTGIGVVASLVLSPPIRGGS
jgi:hypothetical protein